mmetsp:Transcript_38090/g.91440  ORF Transcript_38090/g.91440 Transcript_38090/m.91440 type:complete len:287 (+) Transcript_38090:193-1053(+)
MKWPILDGMNELAAGIGQAALEQEPSNSHAIATRRSTEGEMCNAVQRLQHALLLTSFRKFIHALHYQSLADHTESLGQNRRTTSTFSKGLSGSQQLHESVMTGVVDCGRKVLHKLQLHVTLRIHHSQNQSETSRAEAVASAESHRIILEPLVNWCVHEPLLEIHLLLHAGCMFRRIPAGTTTNVRKIHSLGCHSGAGGWGHDGAASECSDWAPMRPPYNGEQEANQLCFTPCHSDVQNTDPLVSSGPSTVRATRMSVQCGRDVLHEGPPREIVHLHPHKRVRTVRQ